MNRQQLFLALATLAFAAVAGEAAESKSDRPNIVFLVADDYGYGDCGVQGCTDIPTPHIDSIAREGVRCSNGYVSAPQCAPTRAGLLTGRYQQRFGYEFNASAPGLPAAETTLAERLKKAGYATGLVGKWHLGTEDRFHPLNRGFQEFFGFLGGANPYLPQGKKGTVPRILRGREDAQEKEYLTDAFGREAVRFIERHRREPFFLFLGFNATHGPLQAAPKYLARFDDIADKERRIYAAMTSALDDAIGKVLETLRSNSLDERTLVVFLSDNGGPTEVNSSSNLPLRGVKGETREGGIRVPFFLRWKDHLPAGKTYPHPVIQLDIAPTVLAAVGITPSDEAKFDGVDLLPFLTGRNSAPPHEWLFWRFSFPPKQPPKFKWAVRHGDWKLFTDIDHGPGAGEVRDGNVTLVNLADDLRESHDLSAQYPERVKAMTSAWKRWNAELVNPPPGRWMKED